MTAYVVSQEMVRVCSLLPNNKGRSAMVHALASSLGLFTLLQMIKPAKATRRDLEVYHTSDYLDHLEREEISSEYGLEDDCPPFEGLFDYVRLVAGAALNAVDALIKSNVAICWDGGRHHAQKSKAFGFCYVADCVLVMLKLRRLYRKSRIMYLDLDLHFSDGVSQAFKDSRTSQILTLSIHHASPGFFPVSPLAELPDVSSPDFDPLTLSIPLRPGASDRSYQSIWSSVERVREEFNPDFIVVQCGLDALSQDPCATFNWSLGTSPGSLGWCIDRVVNLWPGKKILLGGGGYDNANAARGFAYLTSIALGRPLALDTEIPDHAGFPFYAPSFTLDIPAGNRPDENTDEYLHLVETRFVEAVAALKEKLGLDRVSI